MRKLLFSLLAILSLAVANTAAGTFAPGEGTFLMDGKPFVVKAAELHYPRIPRPYWEQRIRMCKALGMNTVCLYVFWNVHEQQPGVFDFSEQNDLCEFIRLCQANGMYVILRPGPYVCAEWEMGGLPWWLLRKKDIRLREDDPYFMERVALFEEKVAEQVADMTVGRGGPIIMIQVENEYGSYGKDKGYVSAIRDTLRRCYGNEVTMFQCDWSSNFLDNGLEDLTWTLNFGTGADIEREFAPLLRERPHSPLMCSEYWSGWFDKWGASHETRPADAMTSGIDNMLSRGISFSLYMTHGGTNWGHWAGANSPGFAPDVTSYDYDAPVNEQGAPTEKYYLLREVMAKHNNGKALPEIPPTPPTDTVAEFRLTEVAPLAVNLPDAVRTDTIKTMEEFGQGYGSIIYSTSLPIDIPEGTVLEVSEPHDYAIISVGGKRVGILDRRLSQTRLVLPPCAAGDSISILVEAMGRINFGRAIKDFKGITGSVSVTTPDGKARTLTGWDVRLLPDELSFYQSMKYQDVPPTKDGGRMSPGVYRGTFSIAKPADTFLDFSTWGKGLVYVNGHALGRIWHIGPQQTLYAPGCWLREGENEVLVFDILGPRDTRIRGLASPINDDVQPADSQQPTQDASEVALGEMATLTKGALSAGNGWKEISFTPRSGRYVVIEAIETHDGAPAAIAEIYLTDGAGNRLPSEKWKVLPTRDCNTAGNHTADKIIDLQESTYWEAAADTKPPHRLVIDLGEETVIGGFGYLPRMERGAPGALSSYCLSTCGS